MNDFDDKMLIDLESLCKIRLTEDEIKTIKSDIFRILEFIEELNQVDTSEIKSSYTHLENQQLYLREDIPINDLDKDVLLNNAPDQIASMIKVPTILEN
jgi:aspartyl-tRNA(Asn)/glutamyl-tRNA(Gln) amidotransferase subunit C